MSYPYEPGFPEPLKDPPMNKQELDTFAVAMLGRVNGEFLYWSERLSSASLQLNLGVIGAHWAIWGTMDEIRSRPLAVCSLIFVGLGVLLNLWFASWLAGRLYDRHLASASDDDNWNQECLNCDKYSGKPKGDAGHMVLHSRYRHFPLTPWLGGAARLFRIVRLVFPTAGAALLVLSLYASGAPRAEAPAVQSIAFPRFSQIGILSGFNSGDTLTSHAAMADFMSAPWAQLLLEDSLGHVSIIIVGHVDKRPLKSGPERIYGSNEALALARARVVKRIILSSLPFAGQVKLSDRIVLLSSSAYHVGAAMDSLSMAEDRSVMVYGLYGQSPEEVPAMQGGAKKTDN
jgi:hypothetical protein